MVATLDAWLTLSWSTILQGKEMIHMLWVKTLDIKGKKKIYNSRKDIWMNSCSQGWLMWLRHKALPIQRQPVCLCRSPQSLPWTPCNLPGHICHIPIWLRCFPGQLCILRDSALRSPLHFQRNFPTILFWVITSHPHYETDRWQLRRRGSWEGPRAVWKPIWQQGQAGMRGENWNVSQAAEL